MADPQRVLVIADDPRLRDVITHILTEAGCAVQHSSEADASPRAAVSVVFSDDTDTPAAESILAPVSPVTADVLCSMVENSCVSLAYVGTDFTIVWANEHYCRECGYSRAEVVGHSHFEFFTDPESREMCERVRDEGVPYRARAKTFTFANQPDRGTTYWDWVLTPVRSATGEVEALVLAITEVTAGIATLSDLDEQRVIALRREAELDAVIAALSDPLVVHDSTGMPVRSNPAALQVYGFDPVGKDTEYLRQQVLFCRPDGSVPAAGELPVSRALRGETVRDERFIVSDTRGRDGIVLASASPLILDGEVIGAVTIWHDVSEMSRLVVESRRERELLQRLVDNAPIGVALMRGPEHRFEMVNPQYAALAPSGTPMIGRTFAEVFPAVAADGGIDRLDRAYHHGQRVSLREYQAPVSDPTGPRYWDIDHVPLQSPAGAIDGTLTITREVTTQVLARQRLEAVMTSLVDGLIISDYEGNILEMNEAALDLLGASSVDDVRAWLSSDPQAPYYAHPDGTAMDRADCPLARAARGDMFSGYEVMTRRGDHCRICSYSGAAVRDSAGEVVFAFLTLHDITDRKNSEFELARAREDAERRAAQAEAGEALLRVLMEHVPTGITIADAPEGRIRLVSRYGADLVGQPPEVLESALMNSEDPWQVLRADDLSPADNQEMPLARSVIDGVVVRDEEWVVRRPDGTVVRILCNSGPIFDSQDRISGAVLAYRDVTELREAQHVLEQAYRREHRIADVLQRALMPDTRIKAPGCELAACYYPARDEGDIGGDFYDVFELADGSVALVVGDVSGKGLEAAVNTAMAKHMIRAYAFEDPQPSSVMGRLNNAMSAFLVGERFVTVFYALLEPHSSRILYADAGHDQPLIYRRSTVSVETLKVTGRVVGILADATYTQEELSISAGDILLIYTDGISEAGPHRQLFGQEGIAEVLLREADQPLQHIADSLVSAASQVAGGNLEDDAAVLAARFLS